MRSPVSEPVTSLGLIGDRRVVVDRDFGFLPACSDQQQADVRRRSERCVFHDRRAPEIGRYRTVYVVSDNSGFSWLEPLLQILRQVASISFAGSGVSVNEVLVSTGGQAEIWLDGELYHAIDTNSDEDAAKARESKWHGFGLENKTHDLRAVVLGKPYGNSSGTNINITTLQVFE